MNKCKLAPRGWYCKRSSGHDGPCAALPKWWNLPMLKHRVGWLK